MTEEITKQDVFQAMDRLYERADYYAAHSIADNTRLAYESDWKQFVEWRIAHDILETLPAAPATIAAYFTDLADSGSSVSTISRRSTAISVIHSAAGFESPCKTAQVARVLKGIRKERGKPQVKARPISWSELKRMVTKCDSSIMGRRDAAMLLLGWTSALRRSELVALNYSDLSFTDEGILLTVTRSKTDQEGKGQTIGIPRGESPCCPVEAVQEWLSRRFMNAAPEEPEKTPLFVNIGMGSRRLWWAEEKGRITDRMVSIIVKRYAAFAGLPIRDISAHSLRRGFATECGAHALPERIIARHTRHRSMEVLRGYIEDGSIWRENPLFFIYGIQNPLHIVSSNTAV
ncbi:MAG: hypothetical protein A2Y72_07695 [Chloroflexi bacterium RBG_13_53_26]|nr:MAG: hypothetical protein A2Y72_07695 [Chloroflexi bacterium RBG_13_53_26]